MSDTLTVSEKEAAIERIVRNQLAIKELEEENTTLKAYFKDSQPLGVEEVGRFYIKVTENKRVDDALAKVKLSASEYKRLSKTVIDGTLAKKALNSITYASIQKVYDNKIEVGIK